MRGFAVLATALCILCAEARQAATAAPPEVDLALVLAADISTSMDVDEQQLQRNGYVAAFRNKEVIQAIADGTHGRIAVTYVEWAGPRIQYLVVPWTIIADRAAAEAFATALALAPLRHDAGTSISGGLEYAGTLFNQVDYDADRLSVDVSGDGPNNTGYPVTMMRDWLIRRGEAINGRPATINGLPIMLERKPDTANLDIYYEDCVIGGPGAFIVTVNDAGSFETAIRRKLVLEIAGFPVQPTLVAASARSPRIDCLIGEKSGR
jgi:hypothetical protein